jgi:hypothetical protein
MMPALERSCEWTGWTRKDRPMPDNLPSAKKPVIQKTPPTTSKVPAPPYTPTPPKKPAK